jgi:uroporphyrinogen decarboxylase
MCHPLAGATLRQVHEYAWPQPDWPTQLVGEPDIQDRRYAVVGGQCSLFWHDLIDLMGMENACVKMHEEPRLIDTVLQYVVDWYVALNRRIFEAARQYLDIFLIANDFGSQRGPVMSVAMFQRFMAPHLRRLVILGHDYRLKVVFHSCGGIYPLIPTLIECGIDALNPLQPCRGMDFRRLKAEFGKHLVLSGGIDAQHTLIEGAPADVCAKTREVLEIMKPRGGYIGGLSHDAVQGEMPVANVLAMFDTLYADGSYGGQNSRSPAGLSPPHVFDALTAPFDRSTLV